MRLSRHIRHIGGMQLAPLAITFINCQKLSSRSLSNPHSNTVPTCAHMPTPVSIAPWRMRKSGASLNPVQRAAAIAHEDLPGLTGMWEDGSNSESVQACMPQVSSSSLGMSPSSFVSPTLGVVGGAEQQQQGAPLSQGARGQRLGALQGLPVVAPSNESLSSALKRASKVAYSSIIKNEAEKERNRAARQMDTLMKELSVPLSNYVKKFPVPNKLHPFESALLALTVSQASYSSTLSKVDSLRKAVQEIGKSYANKAANASNKQNALEIALEGCEAIERVYRKGAKSVDDLKEIAKKLRALPSVDRALPTLALVGAPNVGKSSLVRVLSSGTPEVCNYPFTTRSIKMGHFYIDGRKHQVTDTPGVMSRGDDERNKMELLTLAALDCLPTSVLFVMDLTEECGTSIADQWSIRRELRARYKDKPWIDALSKCDMLEEELQRAGSFRAQLEQQHRDQQALLDVLNPQPKSSAQQDSLQPFTAESAAMASEHRLSLLASNLEDVDEIYGDASEVAARLPGALAVSSLTQQGIVQLQASIIEMFSRQAREEHAMLFSASAA